MIECTLRDLATEQALRHPTEESARGIDLGIPRSSDPLVASGKPVVRFRSPEGSGDSTAIPVVSQASFGHLALRTSKMSAVDFTVDSMAKRTFDNSCLRDGDVVICTGNQFKVALVGPGSGAYVPASFAIIRMDSETLEILDPAYLAGWLSTPYVRDELIPSLSGKKTLSIRRFLDVSVPIPPMDVQSTLGDMVRSYVKREVQRWEVSSRERDLVNRLYEEMEGRL